MARPSVADVRRPEIVAGTIECLKRHGFAGTTLSRIAETCNMSRGHVRYYMGNREDLLLAAARAFFEEDEEVPEAGAGTLDEIVDYFLGDSFTNPNDENKAVRAFLDASQEIPAIQKSIRSFYIGQRDVIAQAIRAENSSLTDETVEDTAHSLLTFALGNAFFSDIDVELARGELPNRIVEQLLARVR